MHIRPRQSDIVEPSPETDGDGSPLNVSLEFDGLDEESMGYMV